MQITDQSSEPIDYQIDFKHFSINTKTSKSTLMDFVENFRRNIVKKDFHFLLKNYYQFRTLTVDY